MHYHRIWNDACPIDRSAPPERIPFTGARLWRLQAMRKENGSVQFAALVAAGVFVAVSLAAGAVARFGQSAASDYSAPVMVGRIEAPDVTESSGLSASECQDVLWTHND